MNSVGVGSNGRVDDLSPGHHGTDSLKRGIAKYAGETVRAEVVRGEGELAAGNFFVASEFGGLQLAVVGGLSCPALVKLLGRLAFARSRGLQMRAITAQEAVSLAEEHKLGAVAGIVANPDATVGDRGSRELAYREQDQWWHTTQPVCSGKLVCLGWRAWEFFREAGGESPETRYRLENGVATTVVLRNGKGASFWLRINSWPGMLRGG